MRWGFEEGCVGVFLEVEEGRMLLVGKVGSFEIVCGVILG